MNLFAIDLRPNVEIVLLMVSLAIFAIVLLAIDRASARRHKRIEERDKQEREEAARYYAAGIMALVVRDRQRRRGEGSEAERPDGRD